MWVVGVGWVWVVGVGWGERDISTMTADSVYCIRLRRQMYRNSHVLFYLIFIFWGGELTSSLPYRLIVLCCIIVVIQCFIFLLKSIDDDPRGPALMEHLYCPRRSIFKHWAGI